MHYKGARHLGGKPQIIELAAKAVAVMAAVHLPKTLCNNNNNNPICKAPECQKTSVAHSINMIEA